MAVAAAATAVAAMDMTVSDVAAGCTDGTLSLSSCRPSSECSSISFILEGI